MFRDSLANRLPNAKVSHLGSKLTSKQVLVAPPSRVSCYIESKLIHSASTEEPQLQMLGLIDSNSTGQEPGVQGGFITERIS